MSLRRAFTLIELMVVVAIISIIAAILVPNFLQARKRAQERREPSLTAEAAPPPAPSPTPSQPAAELRSADLHIRLHARAERTGLDVATPYRATVNGTMVWGLPNQEAGPRIVRVFLPFPRDASEATDVCVQMAVGGQPVPPERLRFEKEGVSWTGKLSPDQEVEGKLHFQASGQDQLWLPLGQASRVRQLKISLDRSDSPHIRIPAAGLQPSLTAPDLLQWDFQNLVNDRPLIVDMPTDSTVDAKILLLCRLVGLAVLIYGLGFWYLGELHQPGRLARFNWGNFLLLALNYSFFFPALAVLSLGMGLDLLPSLGVAAALSLPLLTLHVARIVDLRFAFSNLALACLTTGVVVNGVFGGPYRLPVYLGWAFLCIGFVTLTFRRWAEHRQAWQRSCEARLIQTLQDRQEEVKAARQLVRQALTATGPSSEREMVEKARLLLQESLRWSDTLLSEANSLTSLEWGAERRSRYSSVRDRADSQHGSLVAAAETLRLALARLEEMALPAPAPQSATGHHCLACGQAAPDSRCCPHCGVQQPLRLQCGCGQSLSWPVAQVQDQAFHPHCGGCGSKLKV